jgi:benzoyl-CoA reductase/2-hydroxyglutaryl-CoA dehydratase subunit BcrC/BadD/HgdB
VKKKKLVSIAIPNSDLAFAAGAVPAFPIRMEMFDINRYLTALGSATSFFGWSTVAKFLSFVKQFDSLKIADNILGEVIESLNLKYNEMYDLGIEKGLSSDFCYGLKALVGMHISKGKNYDANLNFTIRCSAWNKYLESLKIHCPQAKQIWVEVPPRNIGNAEELLKENILHAISELEDLTGNTVTDNSLRKQFRIRNQIVRYYKTILHEISASDFYPCNPATFAEILSLLSISFQDYNSDAVRYLDNMGRLVREMKERARKRIGMDCSYMSRILVAPIFGGWEPLIHEYLYEMGARTIYADWEILGYLEEIDLSGDPIEGYAKFQLNTSTIGIGCDNTTITDSYIRIAKKLKVDGIIFNQVFGCHSFSNCYTLLKDKTRRLEMPTTVINFNKIGENVEQVKTRLGAFIEML